MCLANDHTANLPGKAQAGFTLLEIMVSIAIVAVLAGLVAPVVFQHVGDAKRTAAKADIASLGLALDAYALAVGHYPTTDQGLAALVRRPDVEPGASAWRGPYLKRAVPKDPWGTEYQYVSPGTANPNGYDLFSFGRDGRLGGADDDADILFWEHP